MIPAMTAQQWSEWKGEARKTTVVEANGDTLELHRGEKGADAPEGGVHHAIAAAALHGKSFGFTMDDVWDLKKRCDSAPEWGVSTNHPCGTCTVCEIAARIEALLCPAEVAA